MMGLGFRVYDGFKGLFYFFGGSEHTRFLHCKRDHASRPARCAVNNRSDWRLRA